MTTFINLNEVKGEHIVLDKPGSYTAFFYNKSGLFNFELNAKNVELNIYGLYIGRRDDIFKVETIQHHNAPLTTSNLFIKGVFKDRSKFLYKGLIRIEKKGQTSHAYQKNQNLVLSKDAFIESKPYLEILANDVFCTHGSTTGKINEDELYYLQTRGVAKEQAKDLIVTGFINDIIDRLGNNTLALEIRKNILNDAV